MSAPQQQTTTSSAEATSGDVLSPPPEITGVDADLPDADAVSDDAVLEQADTEGARGARATRGTRAPADDDLLVREGSDGSVLEALQELTRLAVAQETGVRSRLMLDVGEYRARRKADLTALAGEVARRVVESRQPERLSPMNPFERKVVHDVVAGVAGVRSESEGEEPQRRVVVLPEK